jgi:copper(I)-binding protein
MKRLVISVALFVLILSACAPKAQTTQVGAIEIITPWVRSAGAGETTGGFMLLKNSGSEADQLVKVEFADAMDTDIHETKMVNDVMEMAHVDGIEIPANGQAELKPGSYHVMMMGLMKELKAGEKVNVKLTFEKAGSVEVEMEVRNP